MFCHVLYYSNAQLGPTEILVSLSFSYSEILVLFETNLRFYLVLVVFLMDCMNFSEFNFW